MRKFFRNNSLTIVIGVLLAGALLGQSLWGQADYNEAARVAGLQELGWGRYVTSSNFAVDLMENWQSEYLQFVLYILLTVWLVQRGSSESKPPGREGRESDEDQMVGEHARADSPAMARAGGWRTGIYSHSLLIVMGTVFLLSWFAQAVAGRVAYNQDRLRDLLDPVGFGDYLTRPDFWDRTFQNWQSELLAIGSMAVFAIYLRERGSPESKEVGAPHDRTGSGS